MERGCSPIWNRVLRHSLKNGVVLTPPKRVLLACWIVKQAIYPMDCRFKEKISIPELQSINYLIYSPFFNYWNFYLFSFLDSYMDWVSKTLCNRVLHHSQMNWGLFTPVNDSGSCWRYLVKTLICRLLLLAHVFLSGTIVFSRSALVFHLCYFILLFALHHISCLFCLFLVYPARVLSTPYEPDVNHPLWLFGALSIHLVTMVIIWRSLVSIFKAARIFKLLSSLCF